jgi:hypothetical protein
MLELFTKIDRAKVKIDGVEYEIMDKSELSDAQKLEMMKHGRVDPADESTITPARQKEIIKAINWQIDKILLAPKKVVKKLSFEQKITILSFFLKTSKERQEVNTKE